MMAGMDSQFIANFHSGIAAYAALFFAYSRDSGVVLLQWL